MTTALNPSFTTSFWGKDDRGSEVVINRMHQGAQTCEELLAFHKERIQLEEEYSRRLNAISKKTRGTYETGFLRESFETLRNETEQMSRSHLNQARKLHSEALLKVDAFLSNFLAKCKPLETSVENLTKNKNQLEVQVSRLKEKYANEVSKLNTYIAQENLLLGKELEKNHDRTFRQQQIVSELRSEYHHATQKLEETQKVWISEWKNASSKLQDLEMERIQFIVSNLWEYTNTVSTSCVTDDAACENVRASLEQCDPQKEISTFVKKFKTGSEIYSSPKFVDYLNGGDERDSNPVIIEKAQPFRFKINFCSFTTTTTKTTCFKITFPNDGQTSISNPSSTGLHREESGYSNPTSISSFTESVDNEARLSKNWNSPLRRRSRNSEFGESWNSGRKNSSRKSFILEQQPTKPSQQQQYVVPPNEDPLRATLEDLKIGGNGDMNKFRELLQNNGHPNQITNTRSEPRKSKPTIIDLTETPPLQPDFSSSMSSDRTNATTIRPKSMIMDTTTNFNDEKSMKRSFVPCRFKISKAIFDFKATIEGELSFKENDLLLVVHMQDDGWWECEKLDNGKTGLAPYNYLERV
ncbi:unnamed protein product [Wickerhamomyces anomalus]